MVFNFKQLARFTRISLITTKVDFQEFSKSDIDGLIGLKPDEPNNFLK